MRVFFKLLVRRDAVFGGALFLDAGMLDRLADPTLFLGHISAPLAVTPLGTIRNAITGLICYRNGSAFVYACLNHRRCLLRRLLSRRAPQAVIVL